MSVLLRLHPRLPQGSRAGSLTLVSRTHKVPPTAHCLPGKISQLEGNFGLGQGGFCEEGMLQFDNRHDGPHHDTVCAGQVIVEEEWTDEA